ncbi:MAG: DUF3793 family protein [Deltaproteobacteria bacterium]|nr:DUF3793 family protein [Deltaproteobacteria bacterium]
MQCLQELQATDFHKIGRHYFIITKNRECLRLNQAKQIVARKTISGEDYFKFKLLCHLAATMAGIKPITMMRFKPLRQESSQCVSCIQHWREIKKYFQEEQSLEVALMERSQHGEEALIFYHRNACRQLLAHPRVKSFLLDQGIGYGEETVNKPDLFIHLCLKKYRDDGSLPVAMGLLMGIPLKDVKGYLDGNEVPTITSGWRIYGTPHHSLLLANLYRRLRQYAVMAFFKHSFADIVNRLGRSRLIERVGLLAR